MDGLSKYGFANPQVYSETRAFTEVAGIFTELLAKVKTPQLYRHLADAALSALKRYDAGEITSPEADAAAQRLREQVAARGADPEVEVLVAAKFARESVPADV